MPAMLLALAAYLSGHWSCLSGSQAYTVNWALVPHTTWLRAVNASSVRGVSSTSEDMETYDPARRVWRIVDMEPNGTMSVVIGSSSNVSHIATRSVYPDATQYVRFDRLSRTRYVLAFDFLIAGKHARWVDTCSRT
jgi:hypothetical protein